MSITTELLFSLVVQLITVGIFVGTYVATINFMKEQILDLKQNTKEQLLALTANTKEQIDFLRESTQHQLEEAKKHTNEKIEDLRDEMRKYNNVLERMIKVEQSTSSAHKRLDELMEGR